jgi:hypothetical protein
MDGALIPLSERPSSALRAKAAELRQMARTAKMEETRSALLVLAARFDALADKRVMDCGKAGYS